MLLCESEVVLVMQKDNKGTVYLIHFLTRYKHAQHYIGFAEEGNLSDRLERHKQGNGARLMEVVTQNGIEWVLAKTWEDVDRNFERALKNRGGASRICPICQELKKKDIK